MGTRARDEGNARETQGLTRVLPRRWNAAESINLFSWSGSAVLGGYLVDRYSYRATFLVTAAVQFLAALILLSIACVVRAERPSRAASSGSLNSTTGSAEDAFPDNMSTTSSGGYSLLDFDETLNAAHPPEQMTDAQIDELLLATQSLVKPLRAVSEGNEDEDDADKRAHQLGPGDVGARAAHKSVDRDSDAPSDESAGGSQYTTL